MPKPPPQLELQAPESYRGFATEPAEAFILKLPAGTYTLRLRGADGGIVPASERGLVSFAPLDRGIGYVIRPEDRWTQPLVSFAPDEVIYTTGGTDLFFEPLPVAEYEARRFTRLFRPQSVGTADPSLTVWVPVPAPEGPGWPLALWEGGERIATLPRTGFRVTQTAGALRGYTIEEFSPDPKASQTPDFTAARLSREVGSARLGLANPDGSAVERSERQIRVVTPASEPLLFLPALLPLALAIVVRRAVNRRR
jgi:hypothetical protein